MESTRGSEFTAKLNMVYVLLSGYFLFGTAFTNHRILWTNLIMGLDIFKVKWFLAVLAVECPLWAFPLIMPLLFVEAYSFFAGRAGDDHVLTLPFMCQFIFFDTAFPNAIFIHTNSGQAFYFSPNRVVWKSTSLFKN